MHNVLDWLENTAAAMPQKTGVADVDTSLTFSQLRDSAMAAGSWLAERMGPREAVALYLEKSAPALATMLGAVYAGGFYSVLDVRQPATRIHAICEALDPAVVLTDAANEAAARELFAQTPWQVALIEDVLATRADPAALAGRRAQAIDADPLYVNFTSGSTGTPKGVVVSHRSVIDFIGCFVSTFGIGADDVFGNQAPFDFDVSVKDIYSCLACGATLQVIPRQFFSEPVKLMDFICDRQVTTLVWAVSAMCFVSIMNAFDYRTPSTIRRVMFSGEVMPPKQLRVWRKHLGGATYVNLYGPTEITCNCTYHVVDRDYADGEVIPMGRPFANERVLLLDENDALVVPPAPPAPGTRAEGSAGDAATDGGSTGDEAAIGEICVAGTALGLGYLGDAERTAAAFVQNPTNGRWLDPLYRTGDLGRYDAEGNLVYVGRKDHQIKHMGQRIELGDVEAAAHAVPGVERACCLYDTKRKKLVLMYSGSIEKSLLADMLRDALPTYMVPGKIVPVESMPLTKNGKIDRKALAAVAGLPA